MKSSWIFFISGRYLKTRNRERHSTSSFLSILGVCIGVMTLISVMAVMNGLQMGYIEDILEVNSNHLRIETLDTEDADELSSQISLLPGVASALPFLEAQTLIKGQYKDTTGCFVRGVVPDLLDYDQGLKEHLTLVSGSFDLSLPHSIVLGSELARQIGASPGETVSLVTLSGPAYSLLNPSQIELQVTGIFSCGYYDYDLTLAFVSIEDVAEYFVDDVSPQIGVKLVQKDKDKAFIQQINNQFPQLSGRMESWRIFNSSFFNALQLEKILMYLIVGLIFLVVGVNIYQSMGRRVLEKKEDIGILRSLGASPFQVRMIFIYEGLLIGVIGAVIGLVLGLFIASNIGMIFRFIEDILNGIIFFLSSFIPQLRAFSNSHIFYFPEVPSRIVFIETLFIFLFGVLSSSLSASLASKKISEFKPLDILRYQ